MSYQWKVVATNPDSGREVCLYVTETETLARQEWEASQSVEVYSRFTNHRLLRRQVGEWEEEPCST